VLHDEHEGRSTVKFKADFGGDKLRVALWEAVSTALVKVG
jgi:hypothetical protein